MRSKGLFLAERNPLLRPLRMLPVIQASLSRQFHLEMSLPQAGWRIVLVPFGPKNDIINGKTQCGS